MSPLLTNVLLDEVDKELERRGHCSARYADDANVYVRSMRAGERVMALLRRLYTKLHLVVNEGKSAVGGAFGRKFRGYSLWVGRGKVVKLKVADKPLATFKQRIRELTGRSGGSSMAQTVEKLRTYMQFGANSMSGCVTGCEQSSSSTASAGQPCIGNCFDSGPRPPSRNRWRGRTAVVGGATRTGC